MYLVIWKMDNQVDLIIWIIIITMSPPKGPAPNTESSGLDYLEDGESSGLDYLEDNQVDLIIWILK